MPDAKAIIRISAAPDASLRKALASTTSAMRAAAKESASSEIKAAKDAEREKVRASKAAEKAALAAGRSAIAAAKAAEKAQLKAAREVEQANKREALVAQRYARMQARDAEKLAKEEAKWAEWAERLKYQAVQRTSRMAERAAAQQRREAAKTAKQQIQQAAEVSRGRRAVASAAGGAVLGAGSAALGRAQSFASTFGARSNEEMVANAVNFKSRLNLLALQAGVDQASKSALEKKIIDTSKRTGVAADDLLAGLASAQDRFTDLKGFVAQLDEVAEVAVATDTDVSSVVGAMGVMRRQFRLTAEEMNQLNGAMVAAADIGNVNYKDVSENFASALGGLGRNANLQGIGGATTALGIAQIMGAADKTASETATLITNLTTALSKPEVRKAVALPKADAGFGVQLSDHGKIRDLDTIIKELSQAGFMSAENSGRRAVAIKDKEAREAFEVLVTQYEREPEKVAQLLHLKTEGGTADIKKRYAAMNEGVLGQARTLPARQFATFMEGDGMQKYMEAAVKSADALSQITAGHPLMTEVIGISSSALKGLAAALLANKIMGGGGGLGGLLSGGAVATGGSAAGSAATGAAGVAAMGTGAMAATALATGAAAYMGTSAILEATGQDKELFDFGAKIWDATHYRARSKTRGMEVDPQPGAWPPPTQSGKSYAELPELAAALARLQPAGAPPSQAANPIADATLKIKVEGPARVTSVDTGGFGSVETIADNGLRTIFPR